MTTSDSEDFESADEDLELDRSVKKSNVQKSGSLCGEHNKKGSLSDSCSEVSSKFVSENAVNTIGNVPPLGNTDTLSASLDVKCIVKDNSGADTDNRKSKQESNSMDIVQDPVKQISEKRPDRARPQKAKETKTGSMKLGVRLTTERSPQQGENQETIEALPLYSDKEVTEERMKSDVTLTLPEEQKPSSFPSTEDSAKTVMEQSTYQSPGWGFGKSLMGTGGLGSLGGWGSSLLNTATLSVSTLGSHVTQGINTVLETVEAGIGAPSPEELARKLKEEKEKPRKTEELGGQQTDKTKEGEDDNAGELEMEAWGDWNDADDDHGGAGDDSKGGGAGLMSLVTGVTQVTGKVFSTGLDTLEVIGKKTMEVLQEGDPGLKKKRALLLGKSDTVVLSQILREAKEKAESEAKLAEEKEAERKAHFETLFDDFQGLVHLEALEMLSRQSDLRLKSILLKESGPALRGLQLRLAAVQEMCEIPDSDENEDAPALSEIIFESLNSLSVEVSAEKIIQRAKESYDHLAHMKAEVGDDGTSKVIPKIIHQEAITSLATLTANAIEVFHKVTELLLVKEGKSREVKDEAIALVAITSALIAEVNKIATEFSDFLSTKLNDDTLTAADKEKVESYITSTFLEASNSSTYIQDAFQLMVPVLQIGAIA